MILKNSQTGMVKEQQTLSALCGIGITSVELNAEDLATLCNAIDAQRQMWVENMMNRFVPVEAQNGNSGTA